MHIVDNVFYFLFRDSPKKADAVCRVLCSVHTVHCVYAAVSVDWISFLIFEFCSVCECEWHLYDGGIVSNNSDDLVRC